MGRVVTHLSQIDAADDITQHFYWARCAISPHFRRFVFAGFMVTSWQHDALAAFVKVFRRSPVDYPHKAPVTQSSDILFVVSLNKLSNRQLNLSDLRKTFVITIIRFNVYSKKCNNRQMFRNSARVSIALSENVCHVWCPSGIPEAATFLSSYSKQ